MKRSYSTVWIGQETATFESMRTRESAREGGGENERASERAREREREGGRERERERVCVHSLVETSLNKYFLHRVIAN